MWLIDQLAEARIAEAHRAGEFEDLPGRGEPLYLDREDQVPEDLRVAYRILKNAGCVPPEIEALGEIRRIEHMMVNMEEGADRSAAVRKLNLLRLQLGERAHRLAAASQYAARVFDKFDDGE